MSAYYVHENMLEMFHVLPQLIPHYKCIIYGIYSHFKETLYVLLEVTILEMDTIGV